MKGLIVAVVLWAALAQAVSAQAVLGVPPAGGVSFQTPTATPPPAPPSPVTPIQPAPPSAPPRDLFRAGPQTYAPRYDRQVRTPIYPYGGYVTFPEQVVERAYIVIAPADAELLRQGFPFAPAAAQASPRPEPPAPPRPGHKGPLYVIPNCYLGDSLPSPDRLPKGCSSSQARQITR